MLLRFLSEELQVAGARLRIARGENSRTKIVEISQVDATLLARIARLASDRPS
jgi:uncharacterized protein YggU (UPF0235/DUF167 family)